MAERITAVCTPGQGGRLYRVGELSGTGTGKGLLRFEEFTKGGQMAEVPWVRAYYSDGSTKELNVALVEYIDREPPP